MITSETKLVKTWGGFDLTILKVNLNILKESKFIQKDLQAPPLDFLMLPTSKCYQPVELTDTTTCKLRIYGLLSWIPTSYEHPRLCIL